MTKDYLIAAENFFNKGDAYLKEKDYDKAIECHKKALEIAPELYGKDTIETAYKHLGKIYLGKEEYIKAKEYQKKAIEVKHSLTNVAAMAYNNRGIAFLNDKKYEKAITCFKKALKIKSDYKEAQQNLHKVYCTKEEIKKAKEEKKVLEIESKSQSLYSTGNEYFKNKKYKEAIKYYQKSIKVKPDYAVITKEDYEKYDSTRGLFTSALNGELITKTFLFIGFSFSDPNINYILSRLNNRVNKNASRQHYCFIKKPQIGHEGINNQAELDYANTKQALIVNDLKRYKIKSLLIDNYDEITEILREIEKRYNKQTIFISGSSCGEYGRFSSNEAQEFIHNLSKQIVLEGFTVVNGFGLGVGSAVINGALDAIDTKPQQCSDDQLIMKPFPQFATSGKTIPELWNAYRRRIIPLAGIAIFIFGNKKDSSNNTIPADGVEKEFNIAIENGLIPIPIATTGYIAKVIYDRIIADSSKFLQRHDWILQELNKMNEDSISQEDIIKTIINIIKKLNK
ncbi:hypothetical protein FACS189432_04640 [Bacteroidia bacterium]|nr:hypothetical protein FACS189432_04640 [Bacteroidia bacterium]